MITEVRLRPLRHADFDRVLQLERDLFGRGAWTYGMLAEELAGVGRWYIVAEPERLDRAGDQPVIGYAGLWFDGDVTQIMTIGVDISIQRHSVGRQLLEALIERSNTLGAEAILLEVRVDNEPAIALYREFGFQTLGVRKRYYQPENKDAYTMRLDLAETDTTNPPSPSTLPGAPGTSDDQAGDAA